MSKQKLDVGALEVETFPAEPVVLLMPPIDTEFNEFTCARVGCTWEAPCV